jgi:DNA-binding transcriptional regulator LsrR (DeoR family)
MVAEAIDLLYRQNPLQARVAQCRYLLGMTVHETAGAMNVSGRTVERLWQEAKTQLGVTLKAAGASAS